MQHHIDWDLWQDRFQARLLPLVRDTARRMIAKVPRRFRADYVDDCEHVAWMHLMGLILSGQDPAAIGWPQIAAVVCRHVRHRPVQRVRRTIDALSYAVPVDELHENVFISPEDRRTTPAEKVAHKIDSRNWIASLTDRDRILVEGLIMGNTAGEMADFLGVSPGRVSQMRRRLAVSYRESLKTIE